MAPISAGVGPTYLLPFRPGRDSQGLPVLVGGILDGGSDSVVVGSSVGIPLVPRLLADVVTMTVTVEVGAGAGEMVPNIWLARAETDDCSAGLTAAHTYPHPASRGRRLRVSDVTPSQSIGLL